MNRVSKIAAATAAVALIGAPASQAFAASKTENALIGAAIGALGGALVSKGTDGVLIGAAAGAAIGLATDKPDRDRYGRPIARNNNRVYSRAPAYQTYRAPPVYRTYDGGRYQQQPYYGYQTRYGY